MYFVMADVNFSIVIYAGLQSFTNRPFHMQDLRNLYEPYNTRNQNACILRQS